MAAQPALSLTGLPYMEEADAPQDLVAAIKARRVDGELHPLDLMLLQVPALATAWNGMFGTIRGRFELPAKLRELAIMCIGSVTGAEYEWVEHEPEFVKAGGTGAQVAALRDVPAAAVDLTTFDELERATIALTLEMTKNITVHPETLAAVRALLPHEQVLELMATIAGYNMVARFLVAAGISL